MSKINIKDIKIKQEYLKIIPRMKLDDDKVFDISIKNNGIRQELELNQDKVLLDGHSRYEKAKKYKIEFLPFKIRKFDNPLLEQKYVIECNLQRRHLTNYQKIELGLPLLKIEKKLARQRQKELGKKYGRGKKKTLGSFEPNDFDQGKATEIIAKKIGVSNTTMIRGKIVNERATDEQKDRLRNGKTTINSIYNVITRKERNLPKVQLPKGSWSVCMLDLPIQFNNLGVRGSSTNNYDTIPLSELKLGIFGGKNVRDLFNEDCIIFAWFQASTIFYAKELLSSWGFECVTNIVWDKKRIGVGSWLLNQHEHLVIARKGKIPIPAIRIPSIIKFKPETRIHSSKPSIFYRYIELMYPKRTYLDLFSKYQHNKNWTCFGNEFK